MATRIKILPEELINKIAAGEVVERPASVVKELVENAIDAGAHQVTVDIRGGGRSLIQVTDDGCGMSRDDALLALERHATSKIASTEDLFSIRTLGFRGEALAAIAGVSRFELVTRPPEAPVGSRVFAQGGTVRQVESVEAPAGTTFSIRDLFFNTPARMKFLKSAAVETGHIIDIVMRLALSHEDVGLTLLRGPETLVQASRSSAGMERVVEVLGSELSQHLFPFRAERAGMRVEGYLSGPEISRAGWNGLYAFVNQRFLRDRLISKAVGEAYKGSIPKGRYPVAVVYLTVPPEEVDVNVHPGKIEVRFARPRMVSELVQQAIQGTLLRTPWKRAAAGLGVPFQKNPLLFDEGPRFPSHPTQSRLPGLEAMDEDFPLPELITPRPPGQGAEAFRPSLEEPPFDPEEEAARIESLTALAPPPEAYPRPRPTRVERPEPARDLAREPVRAPLPQLPPEPVPGPPPLVQPETAALPLSEAGEVEHWEDFRPDATPAASAQSPLAPSSLRASSAPASSPPSHLTSEPSASPGPNPPLTPRLSTAQNSAILPGFEVRNFSRMRIIGQYANCFILCQDADELVIIDQHAAHERVTFELLRTAYEGIGARSQLLLTPRMVELPRRDAELLTEHLETLEKLGMEVEPFGGKTFVVKSMPLALSDEDPGSLLVELASDLTGDVSRQPLHDRIYLMLATMACHGSIRANRKMAGPEMEALLKLLDGTDFAYACPHGRPLVARSSRREVERLFKRT